MALTLMAALRFRWVSLAFFVSESEWIWDVAFRRAGIFHEPLKRKWGSVHLFAACTRVPHFNRRRPFPKERFFPRFATKPRAP